MTDRVALWPWLRHHVWCNCMADDPPTTERCKCGLRAALALPAEPGLTHDVRGHYPYHEYPHPNDHSHPAEPGLDVERLARAIPGVMSQETCDVVMGPGHNPLDITDEWYMTPRELAAEIAAEYARLGAELKADDD